MPSEDSKVGTYTIGNLKNWDCFPNEEAALEEAKKAVKSEGGRYYVVFIASEVTSGEPVVTTAVDVFIKTSIKGPTVEDSVEP